MTPDLPIYLKLSRKLSRELVCRAYSRRHRIKLSRNSNFESLFDTKNILIAAKHSWWHQVDFELFPEPRVLLSIIYISAKHPRRYRFELLRNSNSESSFDGKIIIYISAAYSRRYMCRRNMPRAHHSTCLNIFDIKQHHCVTRYSQPRMGHQCNRRYRCLPSA